MNPLLLRSGVAAEDFTTGFWDCLRAALQNIVFVPKIPDSNPNSGIPGILRLGRSPSLRMTEYVGFSALAWRPGEIEVIAREMSGVAWRVRAPVAHALCRPCGPR